MSSALLIVLLGGGGGCGGLYHVSFSRCWIKNSTLSHLLQAARKPPATPSTRPTNRPAPAYPRPPYTRVSSPLQQLCLSEACSTDWIHLAAAARAFSRSADYSLWPKNPLFFCYLPGASGQGCWVWDAGLECGSWPWMNAGQHSSINCKEHWSFFPFQWQRQCDSEGRKRERCVPTVARKPKIQHFWLFFSSIFMISRFLNLLLKSNWCQLACKHYQVGVPDMKSGRGRKTWGNKLNFQRTINYSLVWYY